MPTYSVTSSNIDLTQAQKASIADAITSAHNEETGAPSFLAQIQFKRLDSSNHFLGGRPNSCAHVFVHGMIRGGRDASVKGALMRRIMSATAETAEISEEDVWVYLQDIEASQMIEFGRFLPESGAEAGWQDEMSAEKKGDLLRSGVEV